MNALLEQIAETASLDLRKLIEEGADDIIKAIHKTTEEAQLQEAAPKFALGFKISVDLDKSTFDCNLGWSLKQNLSASHSIQDPNQPSLPITSEFADSASKLCPAGVSSVTISTGETLVTIDQEAAKNLRAAAKKLKSLGK